jgi:alpha-beta hydrolase superfamily lysophospholipase
VQVESNPLSGQPMTLLDTPLLSQRVFFPRPTDIEPSHFVDVDGCRLACYWQKPFCDAGTVLHFHGNGELASEYANFYADIFLNCGLNVCFVEYRGYGLSTGVPTLVAMQGDGEKIVETLGLKPERLIVFGRSLGSLYAIELAHRIPQIAGLIVESGIADLLEDSPFPDEIRRLGNGKDDLIREVKIHFDLQKKLNHYLGHLLVMHAEKDTCLEKAHAERLYAWCGSHNKRLVIFQEGNHNTIFSRNVVRYLNELAEFIKPLGLVPRHKS